MTRRYVIPLVDRVVNPATGQPLPRHGAWVTASTFWVRRQKDGSVRAGEPPSDQPTTAKGTENGDLI